MGYKYSILMCVYNGSEYIERALKSCQEQTYDNFEVIVTDDGSTDDTVEKIKPFLKDKRFRLIELNENVGIFLARRSSAEAATGNRCLSLDGDDFLYPDALESLEKVSENVDAILMCIYDEEHQKKALKYLMGKTYSSLASYYYNNSKLLNWITSGKVYKVEIFKQAFNDLSFIKTRLGLGEDAIIFLASLRYIKKYYFLPKVLYHYSYTPVEAKGYICQENPNISRVKQIENVYSYMERLREERYNVEHLEMIDKDDYKKCIDIFQALIKRTLLRLSYKMGHINKIELLQAQMINRYKAEGLQNMMLNPFFKVKLWYYNRNIRL